jgi:hypothetical protein
MVLVKEWDLDEAYEAYDEGVHDGINEGSMKRLGHIEDWPPDDNDED